MIKQGHTIPVLDRECMIIIGLSGKKRSGKDTVAGLIKSLVSSQYSFHRLGFADALYREVATMLLRNEGKHPTEQLIKSKVEYIQLEKARYRLLLQWYGTQYRRTSNDRYWIDKWLEQAMAIKEYDKPIMLVCTDVRFPNEYECIKQCGGQVWRIERLQVGKDVDTHDSESALDQHDFPFLLANDFSLEHLRETTKTLLQLTITEHNKQVKLCTIQ